MCADSLTLLFGVLGSEEREAARQDGWEPGWVAQCGVWRLQD